MRKNIFKLPVVALIAFVAMAACKDDRNNFMVDDSILFRDNQYMDVSLLSERCEFAVIKSGKGTSSATAVLTISELALAEYNEKNKTNYELLPADLYHVSAMSLDFSEGDINKTVEVTWNDSDIVALGDETEYAIPFLLSVADDALKVNGEMNVLIINPKWSYVSMEKPEVPDASPNLLGKTVTREASIVMDYPVKAKDIAVSYEIDNSLVASYNEAKSTQYAVAPEGFVSMQSPSSVIAAGKTSTVFKYDIVSDIFITDGRFEDFDENGYVVPIRLTSVDTEGVKIRDDVMYVIVTLNIKEIKGPWTVLEGQNLCYARQEGIPAPGWASMYIPERMFDGDTATEWISWWDGDVPIPFPMVFVVDMGVSHVFTRFFVTEHTTHQGQYRNFEIYLSEEYDGETTEWTLAASGRREFTGTLGQNGPTTTYNFPPDGEGELYTVSGRYLKFVIVNPESTTGDLIYGRGKLAEVFGEGY